MDSRKTFLVILITMVIVQDVSSSHYPYYKKKESESSNKDSICNAVADIVFLFDESGSIPKDDPNNYNEMIKFIMAVVSGFEIGPNAVQFAVECFNVKTRTHFFLNDHHTLPEVEIAIEAFKSTLNNNTLKRTAIGRGLESIQKKHFMLSNGGTRPCAVEMIVVLTDGNSNKGIDPGPVADSLKEEGVKIFVVGIGSKVSNKTLQDIASGSDFIFTVGEFEELVSIAEDLIQEICNQTVCTSGSGGNSGDSSDSSSSSGDHSGGYGHGKNSVFVPVPVPIILQTASMKTDGHSSMTYDLKKLMNQMKMYGPMKKSPTYQDTYKPSYPNHKPAPGSFKP